MKQVVHGTTTKVIKKLPQVKLKDAHIKEVDMLERVKKLGFTFIKP